jgi:hypothetical protein
LDASKLVGKSRHREEQIAHSIDVLQEWLADGFGMRQSDDQPLGASTHGPGEMQSRRKFRSAWHHEVPKRLVLTVDLIDPALDLRDMRVTDPNDSGLVAGTFGRGKIRTDVEHAALDLSQNGSYNFSLISTLGRGDAES